MAVAICLLAVAIARAQQAGSATLTGGVIDETNAALPGVTVTVTELATSAVRTTTTDEAGVFRIAALPPGQYTVRADLEGFKPVTVTELSLLSSEVRDLGRLKLAVGTQAGSLRGATGI